MSLPYVYHALPASRSIRLLRLFPSTDANKPLRGQLIEYSLQGMYSQEQPYSALSYVWGQITNTKHSIEIDGCTIPITINLQTALSHIRHRRAENILWVDALCINQEDNKEKEHQIGLMHQIYACASCVIVWLGETKDESAEALEELRMIGIQWHNNSKSAKGVSDKIVKLFQRPWFRRVWVLQEVGAARHVRVQCGYNELDGYAFGIAANLLTSEAQSEWHALQSTIRSIAYLMQGSIFRPSREAVSETTSEDICTFGELIDLFHDREATKVHDKVFALLGMSSNDMSLSGLLPDYSISWHQLLERLVRFVISDNVSVQCHPEKEIATLKATGYVLGTVNSAQNDARFNHMQRVTIHWRDDILGVIELSDDRSLLIRISRIPLREGDIVCLLDGASAPTITRPYPDFSVVVVAVASSSNNSDNVLKTQFRLDNAIRLNLAKRNFDLVWDWHYSIDSYSLYRDYFHWAVANRLEQHPVSLLDSLRLRCRAIGSALISLDCFGLRASEVAFKQTLRSLETHFQALLPHHREAFEKAFLDFLNSGGLEGVDSTQPTSPPPGSPSDAISTLFVWTIEENMTTLKKFLTETGRIDPTFQYQHGPAQGSVLEPILSLAARYGSEHAVKWLLQGKAAVNQRHERDPENQKMTALMMAAEAGHVGVVEMLLEAGADTGLVSNDYDGHHTALTLATKSGQLAVVERLLQVKTIFVPSHDNRYQWQGATALLEAVGANHLRIAEQLVKAGVDVNEEGYVGKRVVGKRLTPLKMAAKTGHLDIIELLLQAQADVNHHGSHKRRTTALMEAASAGHLVIIERLLKAGADVNAEAFVRDDTTSASTTREFDDPDSAEDSDGSWASSDSSDSDTSFGPSNKRHSSALGFALEGGHHSIVERLKEAGAVLTQAEVGAEAQGLSKWRFHR